MVICFTGHRKINGQYEPSPDWNAVFIKTVEVVIGLTQKGYTTFVSGGALGFDQVAARAVVYLKESGYPLKLVFALPYEDFDSKWPEASKVRLSTLLKAADDILTISEPGYAVWKLHARNEWMVDFSKAVVALYLPPTPGGTLNCINYAIKITRPLLYINPITLNVSDFGEGYTL